MNFVMPPPSPYFLFVVRKPASFACSINDLLPLDQGTGSTALSEWRSVQADRAERNISHMHILKVLMLTLVMCSNDTFVCEPDRGTNLNLNGSTQRAST